MDDPDLKVQRADGFTEIIEEYCKTDPWNVTCLLRFIESVKPDPGCQNRIIRFENHLKNLDNCTDKSYFPVITVQWSMTT